MKRKVLYSLLLPLLVGTLTLQAAPAFATFPIVSNPSPVSTNLDLGSVTLTPPTSNSPGAWSVTLADTTIGTATGLTVKLLKAGSTQITFTQAASGAFSATSRVARLTVNKGTPTVGAFAPISGTLISGTANIVAPTTNSKGFWSFTSSDSTIAQVSGTKVKLLDAGTVTIKGFLGSDANWNTATAETTLTITALPNNPSTFTDVTISKDSVSSFNLTTPTSYSTGAWTFTIADPYIASLNGLVVTPNALGKTTITARQAPAGGYGSVKLTMTLTVIAAAPTTGAFQDVTYIQSATTTNSLTIFAPTSNSTGSWSFASSDPTIATISTSANTGIITVIKPGATKITATQAAAGTYGSTTATMTLTVKGTPTYAAVADLQKVVGDPDQSVLPPTSTSTGAWTYTSSNPAVVSTSGQTLHFGDAGSAIITMTQGASDFWLSATKTFNVNILGTTPTIGTLAPVQIEVGQKLSAITNPTSNSPGKWTYATSNPAIAKVENNVIIGVAIGTTTISATQSPGGKYGQSNTAQATITVVAATAKPTPTPTPSASAAAKPTPAPSATKAAVVAKPVVKVTAAKRVITISVKGTIATLTINGKAAKLGKNTVKVGANKVVVKVGTTVIYSKSFKIK